MEADSYRNLTFSGSGDYALSITLKVFFSARSVDANVRFDDGYNFLTGLVADGNPAAQQFTDPRAGRTGTEIKVFDGTFVKTFAIQSVDNNRQYFGVQRRFACAAPLAALGAIAALTLDRKNAILFTGVVWLANQSCGYSLLHYPVTANSLA